MAQQNIDILPIFQAVTQALAENRKTIDQADSINHDHGSNMVTTFSTITRALEQKQGGTVTSGLKYAAKQLEKTATSGSGKQYAGNLALAASQLKGKQVGTQEALSLLQMLIGGGQSTTAATKPQATVAGATGGIGRQSQPQSAQGEDLLGSLLGTLAGGGASGSQPDSNQDLLGSVLGSLTGTGSGSSTGEGADLLGNLLGSLTGNTSGSSSNKSGMDLGDLLNAAMTFSQAKQQGNSTLQALLQAYMAGSGMGNTPHREQSTQLVVDTFLKALSKMSK